MQEVVSPKTYKWEPRPGSNDNKLITPNDVRRFIKRHSATIASSLLIGLVAAIAYVVLATPLYTARTQLVIDPTLPEVLNQAKSEAQFSLDSAIIESHLEIIKSENIALAVIKQLKLTDVPDYRPKRSILHPFAPSEVASPEVVERSALSRYKSNLTVRRSGLSYAIEILYRDRNPELAAKIANATAEAYIQEQLTAREDATKRSNHWLEERIEQLRKEMNNAALDAQEFRARRDYRIGAAGKINGTADDKGNEEGKVAPPIARGNTIEELDSTAQTYRRLYESYLGAYTESVQKQSYPLTNARIITFASPLTGKSHPKTKIILPLGLIVGALVGIGIAYFRHSIDHSLISAQQVRDEIGVECLASISRFASCAPRSSFAPRLRRTRFIEFTRARLDQRSPLVAALIKTVSALNVRAGFALQGRLARRSLLLTKSDASAAREMELNGLRMSVAMPFSGFAHGIKSLKTAISLASRQHEIRTLAITSAVPGEGKTTLTSNLASLYAAAGTRVLLVDGDLRTARLSQKLVPEATVGLVEVMEGSADLLSSIVSTGKAGPDLLPATGKAFELSEELLGSDKVQQLIQHLLDHYDIIIIDLPPLAASVDSLAVIAFIDATVVVAEWGKTPVSILSESVYLLRNAGAKILGVVLNKVDTSTMRYGNVEAYHDGSPAPTPLKRSA